MKLNFKYNNPENADTEILDDFYKLHSMSVESNQSEITKILSKYNYQPSDNKNIVTSQLDNFMKNVNSDENLTWRRVKLMDEGLLYQFDHQLEINKENSNE